MLRPALVTASLLVLALAALPGAAGETESIAIEVVDPCGSLDATTFLGGCDAAAQRPLPTCYSTLIYPPTGVTCQIFNVSVDCSFQWMWVGTQPVPRTISCWPHEDNTNIGLSCAATLDSNGWRGLACSLTGVDCAQVLWGIHGTDFVVGGYSGCNVVVIERIV